jgi:pyruvate kinase
MMAMVWGVSGIVTPLYDDMKDTLDEAIRRCRQEGFVDSGDLVVVVSGFLDEKARTMNSINVRAVE